MLQPIECIAINLQVVHGDFADQFRLLQLRLEPPVNEIADAVELFIVRSPAQA